MKRLLMVMAASIAIAATSAIAEEQPKQEVSPSVQAGLDWLGLIDQGEYALSWEEAAAYFKQMITKEQWTQMVSAARTTIDAFSSRELLSSTPMTTLPGAPDGEYDVLVFKSAFAKKAQATETVTVMKDPDGSWRVAGYVIK